MTKRIPKRKVDEKLWKDTRDLLLGNETQKRQAIETISEKYNELPEVADEFLKRLSEKDQPESVRLRIAEIIASRKHRFPVRPVMKIIENMRDDPNPRVRELIEVEEKRWKETLENVRSVLMSWHDNMLTSTSKYLREIQKRYYESFSASYLKILSKRYENFVKAIPKITLPISSFSFYEPIYKNLEILNKGTLDVFNVHYHYPKRNLETLVIPEEVPKETKASDLICSLQSCPRGKEGWPQYQSIVEEILIFLFVPPLGEPVVQSRTKSGLHIRDFILHIPYSALGFWTLCRGKYNSVGLIVECKDYRDRLEPNDVVICAKYLKAKGLGNFGMLLTREKPPATVIKQTLSLWRDEDKLIVILDDKDAANMIKLKEEGNEPEIIIDKRIFEYRQTIE